MTPASKSVTFGETVRQTRLAKGFGLREFAAKVGMSPTYLSKVERDEFAPPSEEKIRAIAKTLGNDPDELLALAGKISTDLDAIIQKNPRALAAFLRTVKNKDADAINKLTEQLRRKK